MKKDFWKVEVLHFFFVNQYNINFLFILVLFISILFSFFLDINMIF